MKEYFSHDTDALSDIKIDKMMSDYGYLGYGYYWAIVEQLYKNGGRYEFVDLQILAKQLGIKSEKLKCFISNCIDKYTHKDKGLFDKDEKGFWSNSLIKRIELRQKRAKKKDDISDCMQFEEFPNVFIHKEKYDNACAKFGEDVVKIGLKKLENWISGPLPSPKARAAKGKCHDGYFKADTWVISEAQKALGQDNSILKRIGRA